MKKKQAAEQETSRLGGLSSFDDSMFEDYTPPPVAAVDNTPKWSPPSLGDFLSSINSSKVNLIELSEYPDAVAKAYPAYITARCLSAHLDCVLLVNELNIRGMQTYNLGPREHYEFLLAALPKGKRFARLAKSSEDEKVELIAEVYNISLMKAREIADLVSPEAYEALKETRAKGGPESRK